MSSTAASSRVQPRRVDQVSRKPIHPRKQHPQAAPPVKKPVRRQLPEHEELTVLRAANRRFTLPFSVTTKVSLRRLPKDYTGDPFLDLGFVPYNTPATAPKEPVRSKHLSQNEKIVKEPVVPAVPRLVETPADKEVHISTTSLAPLAIPLPVSPISPCGISPALNSAVSLVSNRTRESYLNHLGHDLFNSAADLPITFSDLPITFSELPAEPTTPRRSLKLTPKKPLRINTSFKSTSVYDPKNSELAIDVPPLPRRKSLGGLKELASRPFGKKPPSAAADRARHLVELHADPVPERRMYVPKRDRSPSLRGLERGITNKEDYTSIPVPPIPQDSSNGIHSSRSSTYTQRTSSASAMTCQFVRPLSTTGSAHFEVSSPVDAGVFEGVPQMTGDSSGETTPEDDDLATPPRSESPDSIPIRGVSPHAYFDRSNDASPLEGEGLLAPQSESLKARQLIRISSASPQPSIASDLQKPLPAPPADLLPAPLNTSPKNMRGKPFQSASARASPIPYPRKGSRQDLEALDSAFSARNLGPNSTAEAIADINKELRTINQAQEQLDGVKSSVDDIMQISRGPGSMQPSRAAPRPPVVISMAQLQMKRNASQRSATHIAGQVRSLSVATSISSQTRSSSVGASTRRSSSLVETARKGSIGGSSIASSTIDISLDQTQEPKRNDSSVAASTQDLCDRGTFLAIDDESLRSRFSTISTRPQSMVGSCFGDSQREKEIKAEQAEVIVLNILRRVECLSDLFSLATVSKGFYITYKKHELSLMKSALKRMSPAAWELREVSAPGENWAAVSGLEKPDQSQEYTPGTYLRAFTADLYAMVALKSMMLTRCKNILRPETIDALSGRNQDRAKQLDSAWWRCWTFCRIFGSNKHREDDLVGQLDWLKGGRRSRQDASVSASCYMDVLGSTQDLTLNSILLNPPANFGAGNGDGKGLHATELADMSEIWGCMSSLLDGLRGKTDLARRSKIFCEADIKATGMSPRMLLDEWLAHIMTLGPEAVLLLCAPGTTPRIQTSHSTMHVEAFTAAKRHGLNNWKVPVTSGLLRSFMREAIKRASDELHPPIGSPTRGWKAQIRGQKCLEAIYEMDDTSCASPTDISRASSATPSSVMRSDTPLSAVSSLHTLPLAQRSFGALSTVSALDNYIGSRVDTSPVSPMTSRDELVNRFGQPAPPIPRSSWTGAKRIRPESGADRWTRHEGAKGEMSVH